MKLNFNFKINCSLDEGAARTLIPSVDVLMIGINRLPKGAAGSMIAGIYRVGLCTDQGAPILTKIKQCQSYSRFRRNRGPNSFGHFLEQDLTPSPSHESIPHNRFDE